MQISQLKTTDLLIRQKALLATAELLGSKLSYEQCLAAGIVPALAALLQVSFFKLVQIYPDWADTNSHSITYVSTPGILN